MRGWKALALLAAILAVFLLLLPQAVGHHNAAVLFLLVAILLYIELVEASVPYQPRHVVATNSHIRSTLFQLPPPSQA